ncbi:MAG: DUF4350 domain-containing protein [Chloroflexales bacterium]
MTAHIMLLVACATALLWATPARSSGEISLVATPAFAGNYVPGTWLPIALSITNGGVPISVRISVDLPGVGSPSYVQDRQLAGGEVQRIIFYVPMEQVVRELRVAVSDGGSVLAEQTLQVRPRSDERMLGIVAGVDPQLLLPRREDLVSLPLTAVQIAPPDLPDREAGLGSLGILLINGITPGSLSPGQINALLAWVSAGGHLVLGGGPAARDALSWLPADMATAAVGEELQIDAAPLADLAGAAGPGPLPAIGLTPLPGGVSTGQPTRPAWVTKSLGNGLVTQLAFDPGLPNLRSWAAAPIFWDKFLQPARMIESPLGLQTNADSLQEQILSGALSALPTIAQPPVDWLFLVLIIYTVLIGPVLALGLRRIDRQAWSWLMVPTVAIGFGALLFTLAVNLRAESRVITQISIVEYLGSGQARARTFVGMLAPQDQTLAASLPAGALVRPVRGASGIYGNVEGVGGPITQEGTSLPIHLRAWRLQGLLANATLPLSGIEAEIGLGQDGAMVRVRNTSTQRLYDVVAVYGDQVLQLGDVRPTEEASELWPPNIKVDGQSNSISSLVFSDVSTPGQAAERRVQVRRAMIDAVVTRGLSDVDPGPLVMAWMNQSPLDVAVEVGGAARQSQTLLIIRPHVRGSGTVGLPNGWLRVDPVASRRSICAADAGFGVSAGPTPVTIMLRLPTDLTPLRANALSLNLDSTKKWPSAGVTTELYNWEQGVWVRQSFDGPGELKVADPAPYLSQGRLQLRLSGQIEQARCLMISAKLQGTMP